MSGETRRLGQDDDLAAVAEPEIRSIDLGMPRPWRIALRLVEHQVQMIFDLSGVMVIGRAHRESGYYPDIDLGAFGGSDRGVSREHCFIKLEDDRVVIMDNASANGTKLNGERLKAKQSYPLRHGDEIQLGLFTIQVELLTNPFL